MPHTDTIVIGLTRLKNVHNECTLLVIFNVEASIYRFKKKQTLTGSVNVGDSLKQRVKENKPNCFEKNKEKEKSKWIINPFLIKSL